MAATTTRRRSRLRLAIRLLVAAGLLAWFGRYAYLRLTVMPPVAPEHLFDSLVRHEPPPPGDVTDELATIAEFLNQPVPFQVPAPPPGYAWGDSRSFVVRAAPSPSSRRGWTPPAGGWMAPGGYPAPAATYSPPSNVDVSDALAGDWTPATRPHLQAVIAWLESQPTRDELNKLHSLRGKPWRCDTPIVEIDQPDRLKLSRLRGVVKTLITDARLQCAERGDVSALWQDVQTGLWLAHGQTPDTLITLLVATACESLALSEVRYLAQEREIEADIAADMERVLCVLTPPTEAWSASMANERPWLQALIDGCFTRDANGDGWLVLSAQDRIAADTRRLFGQRPVQGGRVWNLASLLYNDRKTVEGKADRLIATLVSVSDLPYAEAARMLEELHEDKQPFNALDGSFLVEQGATYWSRVYQIVMRQYAARDATRIMIALNRFKAERGEYPETLAELASAYITGLPPDPFGAPSFGYRRETRERYVLYSLGIDGEDDGGVPGSSMPDVPRQFSDDGDDMYVWPRDKPSFEPTLVRVQPSSGANVPAKEQEPDDAEDTGVE